MACFCKPVQNKFIRVANTALIHHKIHKLSRKTFLEVSNITYSSMVALALFALNPLICSHDLKLSTSAKDIVGHSVWHQICWILDSWTPYGNWENTAYMWHKRINITSKQLFGTNGAFHYSSEVRWFEITADYVIKKTPPRSWSFSSDSPLPWPSQVPNSMLWKCCEMSTMYTFLCFHLQTSM